MVSIRWTPKLAAGERMVNQSDHPWRSTVLVAIRFLFSSPRDRDLPSTSERGDVAPPEIRLRGILPGG